MKIATLQERLNAKAEVRLEADIKAFVKHYVTAFRSVDIKVFVKKEEEFRRLKGWEVSEYLTNEFKAQRRTEYQARESKEFEEKFDQMAEEFGGLIGLIESEA